jgi:hypothetical protein
LVWEGPSTGPIEAPSLTGIRKFVVFLCPRLDVSA